MNGIEIFKMFGSIFIDNDEANKSIGKTGQEAEGLGTKLGKGIKTAGKWALGIGAATAAVGTAAFAMANKVAGSFDDISKGAQRAGVTTDFYQEMDYWASQNGISHEQMEKAVGRFTQRLGQAEGGNEKYSEALGKLGVNLDDVRDGTMSTDDAFAQSISTLSEMENEQEKVNLATEMFGTRMARDLMPALQDGSLSIDEAREKAQELGLVIGEDMLDAGVEFQDTWDDLKRSFGVFSQQIMGQLLPVFQLLMDWILENMPAIQATFQTVFDVISTVFATASEWIQTFIGWIQGLYESNQETFTGIKETIQEVFTNVVTFLQEAWETIKTFWQENGQYLLDNIITVFTSIQETSETIFNAVREIIEQVIGYIVPFVQEKLQVLQDFWSENGTQIMEAVQNAFSFIQSVIETVMPAIQFVIEIVWGLIKGIINGALNVIMGLINTFAGLFTGDWSKMWEGIKQLLSGALEFIWNLISLTLIGRGIALIKNFATLGVNLFRGLGGNIRTIFSNIMSWVTNIVSRLVNSVLNFFRNMGSGIGTTVRNIFSNIRNVFSNILSFITGMGTSFLNAGKGLIEQVAKGITGAIGKVTDAVSGVVGKVRDFLPFSPAKDGPLSDLDNLDFEGPISDSISKGENALKKKMAGMLGAIHPTANVNVGGRTPAGGAENASAGLQGGTGVIAALLKELIQAVREGKDINIDGRKVTGVVDENHAIENIGRYF